MNLCFPTFSKTVAVLALTLTLIIISIFVVLKFLKPTSPPPLLVNYPMSECTQSQENIEELKERSEKILEYSKETAKLYTLGSGETLKEITQSLLIHTNTSDLVKIAITDQHHKYYVFTYPSDGLMIKGYISLPANTDNPLPLIILLRGGNGLFGLPHPGGLTAQEGYSVVTSTIRGGINEGEDQYGGDDVNDVKNLIDFLPTLEQKLHIQFHASNKYMIGLSRGGMQLFLALERYPELQHKIKKIVSISGLLNLIQAVEARSDFKNKLIENFGLTEDEKGKDWLAMRQPIYHVSKLSKNLPILIAQGTQDKRVCLKEGYDMLQALHDAGHEVTYVEIEGGNHVLTNTPDFIPVLMNWLEQP